MFWKVAVVLSPIPLIPLCEPQFLLGWGGRYRPAASDPDLPITSRSSRRYRLSRIGGLSIAVMAGCEKLTRATVLKFATLVAAEVRRASVNVTRQIVFSC
jgi:hypothetical protein